MNNKRALQILFDVFNFNFEMTRKELDEEIIKANNEGWKAYEYIKQKIESEE